MFHHKVEKDSQVGSRKKHFLFHIANFKIPPLSRTVLASGSDGLLPLLLYITTKLDSKSLFYVLTLPLAKS